jgi:hypothetical protein
MSQPGSDEISQGMNRRRFPMADKILGFRNGQRPSRPRLMLVAGCAAALVVAAVAVTIVVSRPSYPHAWCEPLLADLHVRGESDLGYAAALARLRRSDHAPVGRLLQDLRDYAVARSVAQYPGNVAPSGSAAGTVLIFATVKGDLRALNRQCGQPRGAYEDDSF